MNKNILIISGLLILIITIGVLYYFLDYSNSKKAGDDIKPTDGDNLKASEISVNSNELKIEVLRPGNGPQAKNGDRLTMHYMGTLINGAKFDSSHDRGQPFIFTLGAGQVIQGWERGVLGMKAGERRRLTIPPSLGYGELGTPGGPIPPNAVLIFEIELLQIN